MHSMYSQQQSPATLSGYTEVVLSWFGSGYKKTYGIFLELPSPLQTLPFQDCGLQPFLLVHLFLFQVFWSSHCFITAQRAVVSHAGPVLLGQDAKVVIQYQQCQYLLFLWALGCSLAPELLESSKRLLQFRDFLVTNA